MLKSITVNVPITKNMNLSADIKEAWTWKNLAVLLRTTNINEQTNDVRESRHADNQRRS